VRAKDKAKRNPWSHRGKKADKAPAVPDVKHLPGRCPHGGDPHMCQAIYCRAQRGSR
jgi:hypothetical protein